MATIIRRDGEVATPAADSQHPLTFTLSNMAERGDAYVARVRHEAAQEVKAAKAEAGAIRAKAEAEARAKAATEAADHIQQEASKRLQTLQPAVRAAVRQIADARGEWLAHWESAAVRLAALIAERIVRRELKAEPQIAQEWVREALELSAGSSEITVRFHPTDFENAKTYVEQIAGAVQGLGEARVVADESVEQSGCVVDTKYGRIDHGLTAQLDRLTEELL